MSSRRWLIFALFAACSAGVLFGWLGSQDADARLEKACSQYEQRLKQVDHYTAGLEPLARSAEGAADARSGLVAALRDAADTEDEQTRFQPVINALERSHDVLARVKASAMRGEYTPAGDALSEFNRVNDEERLAFREAGLTSCVVPLRTLD